jgi:hypothetical protein
MKPPRTDFTAPDAIQPGDWAVVDTGSRVSATVKWAEYVADRLQHAYDPELPPWNHAVMCTRVSGDGVIWITEAEGRGAVNVPWHYDGRPHKWSTGILASSPEAAAAAYRYACPGPWGPHGVPYSYLDYEALALHTLRMPAPGLRQFIANSHHMICSQLVDQALQDGGVHLFTDGRWPGYVKPSDLGKVLDDPHGYGGGQEYLRPCSYAGGVRGALVG